MAGPTRTGPVDVRRTRAWRKLRDQVVEQEPDCRLRYAGICTGASTTADHIVPIAERPDLALERANLRGSCEPCNLHRGKRSDAQVAAGLAPRARALSIFRPVG